jgi:GNAT superfamily N-acetyltransferase
MKTSIRKSTVADLTSITQWLKEEQESSRAGFYCNIGVITSAHCKSEMVVLLENNVPVAFLANGLTRDGILEVRTDRRRRGYGKALAEAGMQQAIADDVCVLEIQCAPATSIPFWEHLGFKVYSENYATRVLPKLLTIPDIGENVDVEIRIHHDPDQHAPDTSVPTHIYKPGARRGVDGVIYLEERIIFGVPTSFLEKDFVGRVLVNGKDAFFDKLKYDAASELGVCRDKYGNFYIDHINTPSRSR